MLTKSEIERIVFQQFENKQNQSIGIEREKIKKLNVNSSLIKIVSGIRRCGKSTLLHQLMRKVESPFYLNFESPGLFDFGLNDFRRLDEVIQESGSRNLFFDEIQNVDNWELFIRSKHDEEYNIFITGSNARMLSAELGTKLTGRYSLTELFPFSFNEFLFFKNKERNVDSLTDFLQSGGFPEFLKSSDIEYLQQVYSDIIYRDVVVRHQIRKIDGLKSLSMFLISNVGKKISYTKIKNRFDFGATNTVGDYISFFVDCYLFFVVSKFDFSVNKQLISQKKIYSIDTGLTSINSLSFSHDIGIKLENLVFLSLRNSYKEIFYFSNKHECDFMIRRKIDDFFLVQVCVELNQDNIDREINGLTEAMDYVGSDNGIIITLDQRDQIEKNNHVIQVVPFYEFNFQLD